MIGSAGSPDRKKRPSDPDVNLRSRSSNCHQTSSGVLIERHQPGFDMAFLPLTVELPESKYTFRFSSSQICRHRPSQRNIVRVHTRFGLVIDPFPRDVRQRWPHPPNQLERPEIADRPVHTFFGDRFEYSMLEHDRGVEEQNPPNPALSDEHRAVTSAAWTYR